jgi:hypothetical protein
MPVKITKVGKNKYRVSTPNRVHAKGTTKEKALAQEKIINMAEHGIKIRNNRRNNYA